MKHSIPEPAAAANIRAKAAGDVRRIHAAISGAIGDGTLAPGARLPTERALASHYGATRGSVRKTMEMLEREGLVTRRVGSGSFVAGQPRDGGSDPQTPSLAEILEARLLFEPEMASLVVERAGPEDFAEMERCLEGIRSATDWAQYKERKYALHLAITRATRNRFLVQTFEAVIAARRRDGWGHRGQAAHVPPAVREAALKANGEIVAALRAGEAARARAAMQDYLTRVLASLNGF